MNKLILTAAKHWKLLSLYNFLLLATTIGILVFAKKTWTAESKLILPKPTTALNADLGTLGNISGGQGAVFSQQLNSLKILASIITSKMPCEKFGNKIKNEIYIPAYNRIANCLRSRPKTNLRH